MIRSFCTTQVSGPGLQSATANHPTHVIVELIDYCNTVPQKVTAELELISKATETSPSISASVAATSPSQYKVSYTATSRGQHKLHVQLNDKIISGSPFIITVYPDPTKLAYPVKVVTGLDYPYGIALNSHGVKIVTQRRDNQNLKSIVGEEIQEYGDNSIRMSSPRGIAIDNMDRIYVTSDHKLHKFTSSGELIKSVGEWGSKEGHFNDPRGLALYDNEVYVCDRENHRIQVFDLDLNFIKSIGSIGKEEGEFDAPKDVKFDTAGNLYVAEWYNDRVQVLNRSGQFMQVFGEEKLRYPAALHIIDKHVYVSNIGGDTIVVYDTSGKFITSFGEAGVKEGQLKGPRCITSCPDGFIYVIDSGNGRIQIF